MKKVNIKLCKTLFRELEMWSVNIIVGIIIKFNQIKHSQIPWSWLRHAGVPVTKTFPYVGMEIISLSLHIKKFTVFRENSILQFQVLLESLV